MSERDEIAELIKYLRNYVVPRRDGTTRPTPPRILAAATALETLRRERDEALHRADFERRMAIASADQLAAIGPSAPGTSEERVEAAAQEHCKLMGVPWPSEGNPVREIYIRTMRAVLSSIEGGEI